LVGADRAQNAKALWVAPDAPASEFRSSSGCPRTRPLLAGWADEARGVSPPALRHHGDQERMYNGPSSFTPVNNQFPHRRRMPGVRNFLRSLPCFNSGRGNRIKNPRVSAPGPGAGPSGSTGEPRAPITLPLRQSGGSRRSLERQVAARPGSGETSACNYALALAETVKWPPSSPPSADHPLATTCLEACRPPCFCQPGMPV